MTPTPSDQPPREAKAWPDITVKPIFAWYNFWVGWFWDKKKRRLYILPLPMFGCWIHFPVRCRDCKKWCDGSRQQYGYPQCYDCDKLDRMIDEECQ